jgi:hypothetical protein
MRGLDQELRVLEPSLKSDIVDLGVGASTKYRIDRKFESDRVKTKTSSRQGLFIGLGGQSLKCHQLLAVRIRRPEWAERDSHRWVTC